MAYIALVTKPVMIVDDFVGFACWKHYWLQKNSFLIATVNSGDGHIVTSLCNQIINQVPYLEVWSLKECRNLSIIFSENKKYIGAAFCSTHYCLDKIIWEEFYLIADTKKCFARCQQPYTSLKMTEMEGLDEF